MRRRPIVQDQTTAVVLGLGCFVAGWVLLHDAWDGRGANQPWWARPFTWW